MKGSKQRKQGDCTSSKVSWSTADRAEKNRCKSRPMASELQARS